MDFELYIKDVKWMPKDRVEVVFESNGIKFTDKGKHYSLDTSRTLFDAKFLLDRKSFDLVAMNSTVKEGLHFYEENSEGDIVTLGKNDFNRLLGFKKVLRERTAEYLADLRKQAFDNLYTYLTNRKDAGGVMVLQERGISAAHISDPVLDYLIGFDEDRKAVYVFIEYANAKAPTWQSPMYRVYFDELRYNSQLYDLQMDIGTLIRLEEEIIDRYNEGTPVNYVYNGLFEIKRVFKELYDEPFMLDYEEEGKEIQKDFMYDNKLISYEFEEMAGVLYMKIPKNHLIIGGYKYSFSNAHDLALEVHSQDLVVDNTDTVSFENEGGHNFTIAIDNLSKLQVVRDAIRSELPVPLEQRRKSSELDASLGIEVEELENIPKPIKKKRAPKNPLAEPTSILDGDKAYAITKKDVKDTDNAIQHFEIEGIVNRFLDSGEIDRLNDFLKGVELVDGTYKYK